MPVSFFLAESEEEGPSLLKRALLAAFIFICIALATIKLWSWLQQEKVKHIESVSLGLEVVAVTLGAFGFYDLYDSLRRQQTSLKQQQVSLEKQQQTLAAVKRITESLSTRHEQFPDSLLGITAMLEVECIKEVRIMVDFVDYGSYANPKWYGRYLAALNSLANSQTRVRMLSHQTDYARDKLLKRLKDFPQKEKERFEQLQRKLNMDSGARLEDFVDALLRRERSETEHLIDMGIEVKHGKSPLPIFCWIRDDQEAVVCFPLRDLAPVFGVGQRLRGEEVSFVTSDPTLIHGFVELFENLYQSASDLAGHRSFQSP